MFRPGLTPFDFSDPLGKRCASPYVPFADHPLPSGIMFFFGAVLFVQTVFIEPRMNAPLSLRPIEGVS